MAKHPAGDSRRWQQVTNDVDALYELASETNQRASQINNTVVQHSTQLGTLQRTVDHHSTRLTRIETKLVDHDQRFDRIDARMETVEGGLRSLAGQVDDVKGSITQVQEGLHEVITILKQR